MATRTRSAPLDFLEHLGKAIPGFSAESETHQFHIAQMLWTGLTKSNQHSHFKNMMTFASADLDRDFGRAQFSEVNNRLHVFFRTAGWSQAQSYTRGFSFTHLAQMAIDGYLARPRGGSLTTLVTLGGKTVKTVPAAVASKDKSGVTTRAWVNASALRLVKVDLVSLAGLKEELTNACREHTKLERARGATEFPEVEGFERAITMIDKVTVLSHTASAGLGVMAHRYQEADSGRLYPDGISLASVQGVVKDAALRGCWEYDISNCHFTITMHMAQKFGYRCEAIAQYLLNKATVRTEVSDYADITSMQTKTVLLALLYGARVSAWHETAIYREVGETSVALLMRMRFVQELQRDIAEARRVALSRCERSARGWVRNAFGKTISPTASEAQQFAHLLQGVEATALLAAVEHSPGAINLVQHDGFVSMERLDRKSLEEAIFSATGCRLTLDERLVQPDPFRYFHARP